MEQEEWNQIAIAINKAMSPVPLNDRLGFLFGVIIGTMLQQGMTPEEIKTELFKGWKQSMRQSGYTIPDENANQSS